MFFIPWAGLFSTNIAARTIGKNRIKLAAEKHMTSMLDIDNQLFENPPDQFKAPDGNLYLTVRSIVYDSWITWKDALPVDTAQREMLNSDQYANITELAGRIHKFHQALPGY